MKQSSQRHHGFLAALLIFSFVFQGCSKREAPVTISASLFDSASPELKQQWKAAADCANGKDYLGAATNLLTVFDNSKSLTPEQTIALNEAWLELGNKAFQAAENGDKG